MKKQLIWGVAVCLLLCCAACDQGGPTIPLNPANSVQQAAKKTNATVADIIVTSSRGAYYIGETETFTASLKEPDGDTIPVIGGIWATDTPSVATVNDAGLVTIVGQGWANISCTYNGWTGSKQIWGRADCRGIWSGTYSIKRCEIWGDFPEARFCESHGGSGLPIGLILTQTGENLQGTITLGELSTPFVAKPLLDGSLEMEGEFPSDPYVMNVAIGCNWTQSAPSFSMMLYYYKGTRFAGQAMLTCDISLSKTGSGQ